MAKYSIGLLEEELKNKEMLQMKSIVATAVALGLASLAVLESGAHSIVYATPARRQAERRRLAYRMLELKGIKIPPQRTCCTNWICPDSVCVGSTRYRVERGGDEGFLSLSVTISARFQFRSGMASMRKS